MTETRGFVEPTDGRRIAYRRTPGTSPGVIFLSGYAATMQGTKATALQAHCEAAGRAFVRFDYLGRGESSGVFEDGTIGRWADDAVAVLDHATQGPQVVVGSSMGGWMMLLLALRRPERVKALVGLAAAPDFTVDSWAGFDDQQRETLEREGRLVFTYPGVDETGVMTMRLIEEANEHLVLRGPIGIHCPVRLLHGIEDTDVPPPLSLTLARALESDDVTVTYVKGGDHSLSRPEDLARLMQVVDEVVGV